jgi:NADPH:quinone reductase-like Zn-dependent oxidoreductase
MTTNVKESTIYAFVSAIVTLVHLFNTFISNPTKWIYYKITQPESFSIDLLRKYYSGKTCIITGGSSGIGMELVKLLSSLGANVVISSRNQEKLLEVAELYPGTIIPIVLDLEKLDKIDEYYVQVMDALKKKNLPQKIDVLINNAGLSSRGGAMDTSMETLEKLMVYLSLPIHHHFCYCCCYHYLY